MYSKAVSYILLASNYFFLALSLTTGVGFIPIYFFIINNKEQGKYHSQVFVLETYKSIGFESVYLLFGYMPEHSPAPTPERALYGFVLYLSSYVLLGLYLAWGYLPDCLLHWLGFDYHPQKFWAFVIPFCALCFIILFEAFYFTLNSFRAVALQDEIKELSHLKQFPHQYSNLLSTCADSIPPIEDISAVKQNSLKTVCVVHLKDTQA